MLGNFLETHYKGKFVLDVSALPDLKQILTSINETNKSVVIYIPDTFQKLLDKSQENHQYYFLLTNLIRRWTIRTPDIDFLQKVIKEKKFGSITIEVATIEDVDEELYYFLYEKIRSEDFVTHFSAQFNLLGDLVGKIIATAKKQSAYILMRGTRLLKELRYQISVYIDNIHEFQNEKIKFFDNHFPHLGRMRGLKWFLGIILAGVTFASSGFPAMAVGGFAAGQTLRILDP